MSTLHELAVLPYAIHPFSQGLTRNDFKARLVEHGERVRVWECFPNAPRGAEGPNGELPERGGGLFIEKLLAPDVRVMLESTEREVYDAEFGLLAKGQTQIACLPDEIELARGDRVVLIDRLVLARVAFESRGGAFDHLGRKFVADVETVIADGVLCDEDDWELDVLADGEGVLRWMHGAPSTALISFWYRPQFVFLNVNDRNPPRGSDGYRLPLRGILTQGK